MKYVVVLLLLLAAPVARADDTLLKQMELELKVREMARQVIQEALVRSNEAVVRTSVWNTLLRLGTGVKEVSFDKCLPANTGLDLSSREKEVLFLGGCTGRWRSTKSAFIAFGLWVDAIELRDRYVRLEYERIMRSRLKSLKDQLSEKPEKTIKRFFNL